MHSMVVKTALWGTRSTMRCQGGHQAAAKETPHKTSTSHKAWMKLRKYLGCIAHLIQLVTLGRRHELILVTPCPDCAMYVHNGWLSSCHCSPAGSASWCPPLYPRHTDPLSRSAEGRHLGQDSCMPGPCCCALLLQSVPTPWATLCFASIHFSLEVSLKVREMHLMTDPQCVAIARSMCSSL